MSNAKLQAGLEFILGNVKTLMAYVNRDITNGGFEAEQGQLFLAGPYDDWYKLAAAKAESDQLADLKTAYLHIDRIMRALVRLCQYEYCAGKDVALKTIDYWDLEDFVWLEDSLTDYRPLLRELKQLADSLRPALGDPDIEELLRHADLAEKKTFHFQVTFEDCNAIQGFEAELSTRLDDNVKCREEEEGSEDQADMPIVDFVDALLADAAVRGVSEIEIVPGPWRGLIQYRIGDEEEFTPFFEVPPEVTKVAVIRLKILADLDIANHEDAQDGRIGKIPSPALVGRKISLSTTPTPYREKALIRLD
ncbi:MAG: hypothetical protein ABIJ96_00770 [Elusimicrobiota bacterium]